jgi:hypothetical protein
MAATAEKKQRDPGKFTILTASGQNDKGQDTYTVLGEAEGTSKKNAITKAAAGGDLGVAIGDVIVAVSSKQFTPKPISLSI